MMSKGHYKQAEILLRKIAKTNKRTFDEEAFQQMRNEQETVNNIKNLVNKIPRRLKIMDLLYL